MFSTTRKISTMACAIALLCGAVTTSSAAATAATDRQVIAKVSGHTYVLLGPSVFGVTVQQDPLSYAATRYSDGSVRGEWSYRYWEAGVLTTFSGPVTCLTVRGNRAWVGGPITKSSDVTQLGSGAWWQVADNGSGRHPVVPDRTTFAGIGTLDRTQAYCDSAPEPKFIFDVQEGGLRVSDLSAGH
jgi:hypothetical protein